MVHEAEDKRAGNEDQGEPSVRILATQPSAELAVHEPTQEKNEGEETDDPSIGQCQEINVMDGLGLEGVIQTESPIPTVPLRHQDLVLEPNAQRIRLRKIQKPHLIVDHPIHDRRLFG
ncbi:hypothetical protein M1432_02530 [Patescibacteria group bacterium]|nr:hypothetical protein [Patescibacteria group bacterium]